MCHKTKSNQKEYKWFIIIDIHNNDNWIDFLPVH